jgi:hypothetical protein
MSAAIELTGRRLARKGKESREGKPQRHGGTEKEGKETNGLEEVRA